MSTMHDVKTLTLLQQLYPAKHCLVIGAGLGEFVNVAKFIGIEKATFIDADKKQLTRLLKLNELPTGYDVDDVLVHKNDAKEVKFTIATPSKLSGTRKLKKYKHLYPNAKVLDEVYLEAVSLKHYLQKKVDVNWLVIETFTALELLQNNKEVLENIECISCMVLQKEKPLLEAFLQENSFRLLSNQEETNLQIENIIFVKDYKENLLQFHLLQKEEQLRQEEEQKHLQAEIEKYYNEKSTLEKLTEQEKKEKVSLLEQKKKLESELSSIKTKETQKSKENELLLTQLHSVQAEIEKTSKEYEAKLNNEKETVQKLQKNIEQLNIALQESKKELDDVKKLNTELIKRRDTLLTQVNELEEVVKIFTLESSKNLPKSYLDRLEIEEKIEVISSYCIRQEDVLDAIDSFVLSNQLDDEEKFHLCCSFSRKITQEGDKHQGVSFLNNAHYFMNHETKGKEQYIKLIKLASTLKKFDLAVDLEMEYNEKFGLFSDDVNKNLSKEYKKIRQVSLKKQAHGHDLLIDYITEHVPDNDESGKVLVEIGTTRENIPGQGSTMQLAKLCKQKNIKFITVDMDPHNTRWAEFVGKKLNLPVEAVNKKGEEYLRDDIDSFDFVFLDAYDFDHGMHSDLRQSRYEKNLGSKIDEEACHIMHLECAESVVKKLNKDGVVCVDDTWKDENGEWTAKGTLAVPYFLNNEFEIVDTRNNAVLMRVIDKAVK